jgi:hypothetical protein
LCYYSSFLLIQQHYLAQHRVIWQCIGGVIDEVVFLVFWRMLRGTKSPLTVTTPPTNLPTNQTFHGYIDWVANLLRSPWFGWLSQPNNPNIQT